MLCILYNWWRGSVQNIQCYQRFINNLLNNPSPSAWMHLMGSIMYNPALDGTSQGGPVYTMKLQIQSRWQSFHGYILFNIIMRVGDGGKSYSSQHYIILWEIGHWWSLDLWCHSSTSCIAIGLVLCQLSCTCLPARNGLVNEVKFLKLITPKRQRPMRLWHQ